MILKDKVIKELEAQGIRNIREVFYNYGTPALYEQVVRRREGLLAHQGPIVVRTGYHTGRSPNDKFIVKEPTSDKNIWWGKVNKSMTGEDFNRLFAKMMAYIQGKDLYVEDCFVCADERYRVPIRVIAESAWHNLFARNMFRRYNDPAELEKHNTQFTVIQMPNFHAFPQYDSTNSEVFIIINLENMEMFLCSLDYPAQEKLPCRQIRKEN